MATIINLTEFFLVSIGLGVGLFSFLADTTATGAGFLKVVAGICPRLGDALNLWSSL